MAGEHAAAWRSRYHRIADIPGASSPQAADLDGDGDVDVAVVSAYNDWASPAAQSLVWLENDGRARFTLRDLAGAPTHLVTLAVGGSHRRRPARPRHRRHAHELAVRPHVASHLVDQPVERARSIAGVPLWGVALVAVVASAAWLAGGVLAQRRLAARLPALDVAGLPAAVAAQITEADAAARRSPTATTLGALASTYHASLRPAAALGVYAILERLDSGEWRWPYLRGLLLEERGDAQAARTAFERVIAIEPSVGVAWFRQAEIAFKDGRLDDAAAAYDRARDAPPEAPFLPPGVTSRQTMPLNVYARLGLVRVALERRHLDAASREVRTIVDAYPTFGPARGLLREVERAAGTSGAKAGRAFENAVRAAGGSAARCDRRRLPAQRRAAQACRTRHPRRRPRLARVPRQPRPRVEPRRPQRAHGDVGSAAGPAPIRRGARVPAPARRPGPGDHHTLVQQGRLLADLGRPGEAEAVLRRAVLVRDATAEFNLGTVLDQQDRWAEARVHYERALAIDPFQTRAMNNLAAGLDHHGQSAAALGLFERAIAIAPDTADYYVNYGNALIGSRRLDDAIRALATAIGLDPRSANAHNNMGIALARQGNLPGLVTPSPVRSRSTRGTKARAAISRKSPQRSARNVLDTNPWPGLVGAWHQRVHGARHQALAITNSADASPSGRRGRRRGRVRQSAPARGRYARRGSCPARTTAACPSSRGTARR